MDECLAVGGMALLRPDGKGGLSYRNPIRTDLKVCLIGTPVSGGTTAARDTPSYK